MAFKKKIEDDTPTARTWSALVELESLGLITRYREAIVHLASQQVMDAAAQPDAPPLEALPDLGEPDAIFEAVEKRSPPAWWPISLERIAIRVRTTPDEDTPDQYGPSALDPNLPDLGQKAFTGITRILCENAGVTFSGTLHIEILRSNPRRVLGAYKGPVRVGSGLTRKKTGDEEEEWVNQEIAYLRKQNRSVENVALETFKSSAAVIHASAAAINASRGMNVAPPWMQNQQQSEDMPLWMRAMLEAGKIAFDAWTGNREGAQQGTNQLLNRQVPGRFPHGVPGYPPSFPNAPYPTALDPAGPPDLGYTQYQAEDANEWGDPVPEGEYDGESIPSHKLIHDTPLLAEPESEGSTNEEEETRAEQGENAKNPFASMSDAEIFAALEQHIDAHPNPGELKGYGLKLAGKFFR